MKSQDMRKLYQTVNQKLEQSHETFYSVCNSNGSISEIETVFNIGMENLYDYDNFLNSAPSCGTADYIKRIMEIMLQDENKLEQQAQSLDLQQCTKNDLFYTMLELTLEYATLMKWRRSKQIFTFDSDFFNELINTESSDIKIPSGIFERLPFKSFYIDFSSIDENLFAEDKDIEGTTGAFVNIINAAQESDNAYYISVLMYKANKESAIGSSVLFPIKKESDFFFDYVKEAKSMEEEYKISDATERIKFFGAICQSIIYLCSFEPDVRETVTSKMAIKAAKKNGVKNCDLPAHEYKVGERLGNAFRKYTERRLDKNDGHTPLKHVRPHMRRAHWHGYWIGKRNSSERKLVMKWVSEIFCNTNEKESKDKLDVVSHKVKKYE